jgi:hypothetical protein
MGVFGIYRAFKKGLQTSSVYSTPSKEHKIPSQHVHTPAPAEICATFLLSLQQTLCVNPMHVKTSVSSSSLRSAYSYQKFLVSLKIPRHAFSARCCNTSKSLIGSEHAVSLYTQTSREVRSGDREGQSTGPPCSTHCLSPPVQAMSDSAEKMRWCPSCA